MVDKCKRVYVIGVKVSGGCGVKFVNINDINIGV